MEVQVKLLEGQKLEATLGAHKVISDQSVSVGGSEQYPEPFDYFLASLSLCATFYVRKFCDQRKISTDGLSVSLATIDLLGDEQEDKYKKKLQLSIKVPKDFPEKYHKALIASASSCKVKKVIQATPEFDVLIDAD